MTLPNGMLYPINIDNMVNHKVEMKWALAELVDIPKKEQKDYPNPDGGFLKRNMMIVMYRYLKSFIVV